MTPSVPARFSLIVTDRNGSRRNGFQNGARIPFATNALDAVIVLSMLGYNHAAGMIHRSAAAIEQALVLAEHQPASDFVLIVELSPDRLSEASLRNGSIDGCPFDVTGKRFAKSFNPDGADGHAALRRAQGVVRSRQAPTLILGVELLPDLDLPSDRSFLIGAEATKMRLQ